MSFPLEAQLSPGGGFNSLTFFLFPLEFLSVYLSVCLPSCLSVCLFVGRGETSSLGAGFKFGTFIRNVEFVFLIRRIEVLLLGSWVELERE